MTSDINNQTSTIRHSLYALMLYLFQLRCDKEVRLLPIAEQTAALLERALLADDSAGCQQALGGALRSDPFFAVAVRHAAILQDAKELAAFSTAIEWLSENLADRLRPLLAGDVQNVPRTAARRYAALASRLNFGQADDAFWQALVAAEAAILASCPQDSFGKPRLLPAFPPGAPPNAYASLISSGETDYLLESVPGIAWRLPALIRRLQKERSDQSSFGDRLEEEKLLSLRGLAYGASHEINNPLANIAARAQALLRDETAADRRKKIAAIYNQAMRAHEMIADLMLFSHPPKLERACCNLRDVAQKVIGELEPQATEQRIQLAMSIAPGLSTMADATQLAVALRAVIVNSMEAIGNDGTISVSAGSDESKGAWLSVCDDGPGITDDVRKHMFDPFYSGREAGRGHGFGLSKCWRILREHGGSVEASTSASGGTEIVLRLPLSEPHRCAA